MGKNKLVYADYTPLQGHATDPDKCLGTKVAGTVFKNYRDAVTYVIDDAARAADAAALAAGTIVDITEWLDITLHVEAAGQLTYNGDATKVEPLYIGENMRLIHPNVTQLVASVDCIVTGM